MTTVVCDASVLFKLLIEENDTHLAEALAASSNLCAPEIAIAEVGNAVWTRIHDGRLDADGTDELIGKFLALPLDLRPLRPLLDEAIRFASLIDHAIYDCFYLALAQTLNAPLVTADRRFLTAVRRSAIRTPNVKGLGELA